MAVTLSEYAGNNSTRNTLGVFWIGQVFLTVAAGLLGSVTLNLSHTGADGTAVLEVKAESGGQPTGAVLATASIDTSTIGTSQEDHVFTFDGTLQLDDATKYCLILHVTGGGTLTSGQYNASGYAGGTVLISTDSGVSWATTGSDDLPFLVLSASVAGGGQGLSSSPDEQAYESWGW